MKKVTFVILILLLLVPSAFLFKPQKTEAAASGSVVIVGSDIPRDPQKGIGPVPGLNSVIYIAAKMLLNSITQSIVNWINSGFEGNPTFVENPGDFLADIADQTTGVFIKELGMTELCSIDWLPKLKISLQYSVPYVERMQCTLTGVGENFQENLERFEESFLNGGWSSWISMTSNPQNNIYGAYLMSLDELAYRKAKAEENAKMEVSWGSGFVSLKKCSGASQETYCDNTCAHLEGTDDFDDCFNGCQDIEGVDFGSSDYCEQSGGHFANTTPGKIIADQLTSALNKPTEGLNLVQDINQLLAAIFDALISQLMEQGLASLTESPPSQPDDTDIDESSRDLLISEIDYSLENERNYESLREESLGIISDGLITASNCVNCYQEQISAISNPNFNPPAGAVIPTLDEINQKIDALNSKLQDAQSTISTFQSDITASQSLIDQLENLKLEAMMAETNSQLEEIQNEYYETSAGLHSLYAAQIDLDAVQQEYDAIRAEYEQCQTKLAELNGYLE